VPIDSPIPGASHRFIANICIQDAPKKHRIPRSANKRQGASLAWVFSLISLARYGASPKRFFELAWQFELSFAASSCSTCSHCRLRALHSAFALHSVLLFFVFFLSVPRLRHSLRVLAFTPNSKTRFARGATVGRHGIRLESTFRSGEECFFGAWNEFQ
jgi:hypothetical protein